MGSLYSEPTGLGTYPLPQLMRRRAALLGKRKKLKREVGWLRRRLKARADLLAKVEGLVADCDKALDWRNQSD